MSRTLLRRPHKQRIISDRERVNCSRIFWLCCCGNTVMSSVKLLSHQLNHTFSKLQKASKIVGLQTVRTQPLKPFLLYCFYLPRISLCMHRQLPEILPNFCFPGLFYYYHFSKSSPLPPPSQKKKKSSVCSYNSICRDIATSYLPRQLHTVSSQTRS